MQKSVRWIIISMIVCSVIVGSIYGFQQIKIQEKGLTGDPLIPTAPIYRSGYHSPYGDDWDDAIIFENLNITVTSTNNPYGACVTFVANSQYTIFRNCFFESQVMGSYPIYFSEGSRVRFENCHIKGNKGNGVDYGAYLWGHDIWFINTTIEQCSTGISPINYWNFYFYNNTFRNCDQGIIFQDNWNMGDYPSIIDNNTFYQVDTAVQFYSTNPSSLNSPRIAIQNNFIDADVCGIDTGNDFNIIESLQNNFIRSDGLTVNAPSATAEIDTTYEVRNNTFWRNNNNEVNFLFKRPSIFTNNTVIGGMGASFTEVPFFDFTYNVVKNMGIGMVIQDNPYLVQIKHNTFTNILGYAFQQNNHENVN